MKNFKNTSVSRSILLPLFVLLTLTLQTSSPAAPATLLFQDDFLQGLPGWTVVQPAGNYSGTVLWQYDINTGVVWENSNVFTDSSVFSPTRIAPMLINATAVSGSNFTYTVRLLANDNDGCGLIFGYQNSNTFYRVTFGAEVRSGWPFTGFNVDRMVNGEHADLFGAGTVGYTPSFAYTFSDAPNHKPFDVTIGMTNGLFSLTVVDSPTNSPVEYALVSSQLLPSNPTGQVGFFVWGMSHAAADGMPNVGIRFMSASLSPNALTGYTNPLAGTWTTLVTPRTDGTTNVSASGLQPIWTLPLNASGSTSRLRETSGLFLGSDNTPTGTTNFAAASIVGGDTSWSNYVYSARFIPTDDDGFGMLLRFSNISNWYRIAFRPQASTSGAKHGISIQKNVNGVFDEVMWDTTFNPSATLPMDVYASINTNRLTVVTISNPGASQTVRLFGPFDITGGTVDTGQIGLFSWAQLAIDVDFVRVQAVAGQALGVAAAFGNPDPPVGLNDLPANSSVTATNDALVNDAPGVRRVLTGWTGAGSVPASGPGSSVTFNLNTFSLISWNYRTDYLLTTNAVGAGTVSASVGPWITEGTNLTLTVTPNPGSMFLGWSGDNISTLTSLTFSVTRPLNLTANFVADSDGDKLADSWELQYFGTLVQDGSGDPDGDGSSNAIEFLRGSNPTATEVIVASDGLSSRWLNTQRNAALPGQLTVMDFGSGYRGAFETSNQNLAGDGAVNASDYADFQSPIVVVRPEYWTNNGWGSNFSASIEFTVGDNDGNCFYFRYLNESNWCRATLCGQTDGGDSTRPRVGLSIQKRVAGVFTEIPLSNVTGPASSTYTDPSDNTISSDAATPAGFKRVRLTVNATNENCEVRVIGWDVALDPDAFNPAFEQIATFTETNLFTGRIGFGFWGQGTWLGATPDMSVHDIPVPTGGLADNIVVKSPADGATVFGENWETASLFDQFPSGWTNPYTGLITLEGTWRVTAHGTIDQLSNLGPNSSGTALVPKADADGPILLGPPPGSASYLLQIGFQAFDNDGIGFVYDFQDTDNFSRVMFRQEATFAGAVPPGLSVSRKSGGVWTDIVASDRAFSYTPTTPFAIEFANNNGAYRLIARDLDNPAITANWSWTAPAATPGNRFGVTTWASPDAHILYARALSLPAASTPFVITKISLSGANVTLDISKPAGLNYHVLRASSVTGPYVTNAPNQSALQYTEPAPPGGAYYRLQLLP